MLDVFAEENLQWHVLTWVSITNAKQPRSQYFKKRTKNIENIWSKREARHWLSTAKFLHWNLSNLCYLALYLTLYELEMKSYKSFQFTASVEVNQTANHMWRRNGVFDFRSHPFSTSGCFILDISEWRGGKRRQRNAYERNMADIIGVRLSEFSEVKLWWTTKGYACCF